MASCSISDLVEESKCFFGVDPLGLEKVKIVLLCRWLKFLDPMATCNVQDLIDASTCYFGVAQETLQIIQTQLLCEILIAGGGSGNSCNLCGDGDPVSVPDCDCATYYNKLNGAQWVWDDGAVIWRQISGGP